MYNPEKFVLRMEEQLTHIHNKISKIMETMEEVVAKLNSVATQVQKIGAESKATLQAVADLKAALANQPGVTPELQKAVDELATQVQVVDDLVPDAAPPAETAQG